MPPHEIHVWFLETAALDRGAVDLADQYLSAEERHRRDRFHSELDRRDYALAHDLLRRSLSRYHQTVRPWEWVFSADARGKPSIAMPDAVGSRLAFSLSHTRGLVACAVSESTSLGIDVETVDRNVDPFEVAEHCFSAREIARLRRCAESTRAVRFLELWTLREAFVKATGAGLQECTATFSFDVEEDGTIAFVAPPGYVANEWQFALQTPTQSTRMAVAARADPPAPVVLLAQQDEPRINGGCHG
jgi:phosphopantetheinyl transferase